MSGVGAERRNGRVVSVDPPGKGLAVVDRLLTGTGLHAERRRLKMRDTAAYLDSLGAAPVMTRAAEAFL